MAVRGWLCAVGILVAATLSVAESPPRVSADDFAILPWSWVPADGDALEEIRDCGFNLAGFVAPEALDAVHGAGLKAIVSYPPLHVSDDKVDRDQAEIDKHVAEIVDRVRKHPAVYGYYLRDEPNARMFPALGRHVEALRRAAPDARAYINLFPNYANAGQLGTPTYEEHLEQYIREVKPSFISYDHYAIMDDGSLRDGYFQNLEAVRRAALAHDLPFWNIVLSNAHFRYAEPTEAALRFQAFTTMAYGGRGISYFTYLTPKHGNYRLAPIDPFGNKTPTWEMLRRVNLQIHALAPTLIQLRSANVFHHPDVPEGCRGIETSRFVAQIAGDHLMVGEFEGPGGVPFVMIVNTDLHRSTPFDVRLKQPGSMVKVNQYTGRSGIWGGEDKWLAAGQGALLSVAAR